MTGDPSTRTRNTIIGLGIAQGLLLLFIHVLIDRKVLVAPADLLWLVPLYAVAIGVPTALQLVVTDPRERRVWLFGLGLAAALAVTGMYTDYAVEPSIVDGPAAALIGPYVLTILVGWYVLLPFVQACFKTGRLQPEYPDLFEFAWNNIITLLIAKIFTGIFWALLALWAALFHLIGIEIFSTIFYNKYFVYPVTAVVFAFALYLGRTNLGAVVTVRRIILAVFKGLLPLLAIITLLFLAALPFMGLKPLWATGKATALMLWLQILLMIFLNAVYQNGQGEAPYSNWLRTLVRAAVVLLPIYTALCVYGLYLRIDQHGWSIARFWAMLLTFIVGLHVIGYAAAAARPSKIWMGGMAVVNVMIAAIVVALSLAVNSPLLDARRISAASQVGRLLDGKVPIADFDYKYLRFELGRPGNAVLARLTQNSDHPQAAAIRSQAELALKQTNRWAPQERIQTAAQAAAHFSVYPSDERLDDSFVEYAINSRASWQLKRCLDTGQRCAVLAIDLNRDRQKEYIIFHVAGRYDRFAVVLTQVERSWTIVGNLELGAREEPRDLAELEAQLARGDYAIADNPWQNLRVGGQTTRFRPQ